jgi:hypothetical protein
MLTLDIRKLAEGVLPIPINVLLYIGTDSPKMCPYNLPSSLSIKSFSIEHPSRLDRIDKRLTLHNLAYVVFDSGEIVHESWVSFDTLLPSQYGYESRFPVIAHSSTESLYRGKDIYPYALNYILNDLRNRNICSNVYILVSPENNASIRGIEKAGYQLLAQLNGIRLLGFLILNKSTTRFN